MPEEGMKFRYIAIEGVIGVGKTTLVEALAERLDATQVLEEWEENPFLKRFYDGRAHSGFQTELFFLLSRYRQQRELVQRKLFADTLVADYVFEKSRLFAYLNLDDSDLLIFDKLYAALSEGLPKPDVVIYLQASTEMLMKRIVGRGRPEERSIEREYIVELGQAYSHYYFHYDATPLLVVNTEDVDFSKRPEDVDDLLKQLRTLSGGTQYYTARPRG
jgi:deoxyadenosine/deoxycytidine kinase